MAEEDAICRERFAEPVDFRVTVGLLFDRRPRMASGAAAGEVDLDVLQRQVFDQRRPGCR